MTHSSTHSLTNPKFNYCLSLVLSVLALTAFVRPSLAADEMVDNPAYTSWASHQAGSKVVLNMTTNAMGQNMKMEMTTTLDEVTADHVVVETSTKMDMMGQSRVMPAQKKTIPAKTTKTATTMPAGVKGESKELPSETISVNGKDIVCKVMEFTGTSEQQKAQVTGKSWTNPEIPGTIVKMEMHSETPMKSDIAMMLGSVDLK